MAQATKLKATNQGKVNKNQRSERSSGQQTNKGFLAYLMPGPSVGQNDFRKFQNGFEPVEFS